MTDKNFARVFPLIKGKTSRQAHVALPKINDETTYEEEHGRQGFFRKVSHLYHARPPTGWIDIKGPLALELINSNLLEPSDKSDPWGTPITFLKNNHVRLRISRRSEPMPFYYRNADGDDVWFVHRGEGKLETIYGPLEFKKGDYLVIPRGTIYRVIPSTKDNHFLLIESKSEIQLPNRELLGPTALFDPAIIETPEPSPIIDQDGQEWIVRVKRKNEFTDITFPYNPIDVVGWKGDLSPWRVSIYNFLPVMSHRYHLPPSAHTTFVSDGSFVICSFVPRPFETDEEAIKVPFFHSNVDYDEVIFFHAGEFFSRDNIEEGMITYHPYGITHGPHPNALTQDFSIFPN
ncbi:MAG: homogentisate 1,2-dioxygenase [Candidatus Hodarchaeales archaeon]|jgi:homogentisate 1,2-dioxygenase